jgi:hypothetical protein
MGQFIIGNLGVKLEQSDKISVFRTTIGMVRVVARFQILTFSGVSDRQFSPTEAVK